MISKEQWDAMTPKQKQVVREILEDAIREFVRVYEEHASEEIRRLHYAMTTPWWKKAFHDWMQYTRWMMVRFMGIGR